MGRPGGEGERAGGGAAGGGGAAWPGGAGPRGACHYQVGNYKALRRFRLLRRLLREMGIEEERLRLEWISASEADKVKAVVNDMVEKVRALGPLRLKVPEEVFAEEVAA